MPHRRPRTLGPRQIQVLQDAAGEVALACPWLPIVPTRRQVDSLARLELVGATEDLFGILPLGCWRLRRYDRALAKRALAGLRRNRNAGEVMPWHV